MDYHLVTIATAILACCAIHGVVVALIARKTERQKATLIFIRDYNSDQRLDVTINFLKEKGNGVEYDQLTTKQRMMLVYLFNVFEILFVGYKHGIYSKRMIKLYMGRDIVETYKLSKSYIEMSRERYRRKNVWVGFEKLAKSMDVWYGRQRSA